MRLFSLALCLLLAAACSHGGVLTDEKGALRDGLIEMRTFGANGTGEPLELRRILCRGGKVSCSLKDGATELEGRVEADDWEELWDKVLAQQPFNAAHLDVDEPNAEGGPYHRVHLELAADHAEFSAQNKLDFIVFSTQAVRTRLELTNAIVLLIERAATAPVLKN